MEIKYQQRVYLSVFFFLSGFSFASWASRIPTIKDIFHYNDAELGTILLVMPLGSLMGLPLSGWLVSRFDSRVPILFAILIHVFAIFVVGFAGNTLTLVIPLCLYAFSMRVLNISMNTQALTLQKTSDKKINGSFHGLWSSGGIMGVLLSTLLITLHVPMKIHLAIVSLIILLATMISYRFLLRDDRSTTGNKLQLGKPDPYIVYLGLLVFFAGICEGGMFDWSGLYFKDVVHEEVFTLGYLIFMVFMALSRFTTDRVAEKIGTHNTYMVSSLLIAAGISLAIILPYFWTSLIGFCLVGLGTASVIPMTFTQAAYGKKYSPGMAISIIATYGLAGAFLGPPLIGYLAHAVGLRISFVTFAFSGLMLIPLSTLFFRYKKALGS